MAPPILFTKADGVAEIRFNRPERRNVLDVEMVDAISDAVSEIIAAQETRVLVFSAEGQSFGTGGDLDFFHKAEEKRTAAERLVDPLHATLKKLAGAPFITIGSLKGPVAGGSMSLALGLDLAIAAEDTIFNFAYPRVGVPVDCGGSWALPRLVGVRKALEIALLSEPVSAAEALQLGLVNRVVPLDALESETSRLAKRLASGAPVAQARIKTLMRQSLDTSYGEQLDAEAEAFIACSETEDFQEALASFFGKRKPQFKGR